jgi:hypothetical protein
MMLGLAGLMVRLAKATACPGLTKLSLESPHPLKIMATISTAQRLRRFPNIASPQFNYRAFGICS